MLLFDGKLQTLVPRAGRGLGGIWGGSHGELGLDSLWNKLPEPKEGSGLCFGIPRKNSSTPAAELEGSRERVKPGSAWGISLGDKRGFNSPPLRFSPQVFHQVLDVSDLHRLREGNAVRLKMQKLQVWRSAGAVCVAPSTCEGIIGVLPGEPSRDLGRERPARPWPAHPHREL